MLLEYPGESRALEDKFELKQAWISNEAVERRALRTKKAGDPETAGERWRPRGENRRRQGEKAEPRRGEGERFFDLDSWWLFTFLLLIYSEKDGIGGNVVAGETFSAASVSKTTLLVFSLFNPASADNSNDEESDSEEQFASEGCCRSLGGSGAQPSLFVSSVRSAVESHLTVLAI
nr:hypothetical protein Iba_chr05aCG13330 [Ipomoea batatas]